MIIPTLLLDGSAAAGPNELRDHAPAREAVKVHIGFARHAQLREDSIDGHLLFIGGIELQLVTPLLEQPLVEILTDLVVRLGNLGKESVDVEVLVHPHQEQPELAPLRVRRTADLVGGGLQGGGEEEHMPAGDLTSLLALEEASYLAQTLNLRGEHIDGHLIIVLAIQLLRRHPLP